MFCHNTVLNIILFSYFRILTSPVQLPLAKSTTIMSYCHACSGSYSNIDYTFGGKYVNGPRNNVNSYSNSNLSGDVSFEPRRVSSTMYNHVSTRGMCTEVSNRFVSTICILFYHVYSSLL